MKMFLSNLLFVNLTNLRNFNETIVKPDLNLNLNNKSSTDIKDFLANFTTRNIQLVMNQIQHDKYSNIFLFQNIDDCKGALINGTYFKIK